MLKMENVKNYLALFGLLTEEEIDSFIKLLKPKKIKKGEFFIKEGRVCNEVAFVISGFFRSFYYSSQEEEVTYCFTFSNTFITAYSSFISQKGTVENIESLVDVELLTISKEEILKLEETSVNWLKLFKMMAEQEYIRQEERIFLLQKESAERRYKVLLDTQPEYLQLIPLNYLASYLGITQRHLSRIRASFPN